MDIIVQTISIVFWFIVILIPLVAFHELGHLVMARLVGVKVMEYGIGIPPRATYFRWKGIIWSLNYVLLGGFARIYGDHDALDEAQDTAKTDKKKAKDEYLQNRFSEMVANQEIRFFLEENNLEYDNNWKAFEKSKFAKGTQDPSEKDKLPQYEAMGKQLETLIEWEFDSKLHAKDAFFSKNWFQQALILVGGITFNMIAAVLLFWIMFTTTGSISQTAFLDENQNITQYADIQNKSQYLKVPAIAQDSIADKIGLKGGDDLISIGSDDLQNIATIDDFKAILNKYADQNVTVVFRSKDTGEFQTVQAQFTKNDSGQVVLGVSGIGYEVSYKAKNLWSGLVLSVHQTWDYTVLDFKALGDVAIALLPQTKDRTALDYVSGPIAVSSYSSKIFKDFGASGILFLMALVSIGLAAFNVLPLPALDGGRLVIVTLNKIFGRRNKRWEAIAISVTFFLLLGLGILIAFRDIQGIVAGKY
jgi:regulator of sigma E protease